MHRTQLLLVAGGLTACVLAVGAMGRTDLDVEVAKAEEALSVARQKAQAQSGFFFQLPPRCHERLRFAGVDMIYAGFISTQADNEHATSACLYIANQPETYP